MADTGNILSARLEVKDSFSSQLDKFARQITATETSFNKFVSRLEQSGKKMEEVLTSINSKMEQTSNKIISKTDGVADAIVKSTNRIKESQNEAIKNLTTKYNKMGSDVQGIFKTINKDAESLAKSGIKIGVGGGGSSKKNNDDNNGLNFLGGNKPESFLTGLLGGNFTKILGSLGLIGAGITGATKILSSLDEWSQQGFNAINSLSDGLLSVDGIKEGIEDAGQFETNRVAMNILYGGNEELGHQYYKMGVQTAKDTTYKESNTGELQKKLAGAHITYNEEQLKLLADIGSLRPKTPLEHVGFSIVDAMYGRPTSLKTMYMLDNKEVQEYLKKLNKSKNSEDKQNAKKWKDAFNSKGSVNNKQEYFDLLMDFVTKETNYKGLNEKYMQTTLGKIDRLQGNWETLKAEILGIDANDTGMVKSGQITAISSIRDAMDGLDKWLKQDDTKTLLDDMSKALGTSVHSVTESFGKLLSGDKLQKIGDSFTKIGDSVAKVVSNLVDSPEFMKFIDELPNIIEKILGTKVIELRSKAEVATATANGHPMDAGYYWLKGLDDKWSSIIGLKSTENAINGVNNKVGFGGQTQASQKGNGWWSPLGFIRNWMLDSDAKSYLTDANASAVLAQNPNLNNEQRKQLMDTIKNDNQSNYYVTIGEIKADNFQEIVDSLNKVQTNQR